MPSTKSSPEKEQTLSEPESRPVDYESLAEFRYRLRCFLEFSQRAAQAVGLTAQQHQALLAIKGHPQQAPMAIGDIAERLRIRPHSTLELVNRLTDAGLAVRNHDAQDQRRVLVGLTSKAEHLLTNLSSAHLEELRRIGPMLETMLTLIQGEYTGAGGNGADSHAVDVQIKRVYEPVTKDDGARVLVDRLWPRGLRKEEVTLTLWLKDVAPSAELRKWFAHDPKRWQPFCEHYRQELDQNPDAVAKLADLAKVGRITLLYAAKDTQHNHACVLANYLRKHFCG